MQAPITEIELPDKPLHSSAASKDHSFLRAVLLSMCGWQPLHSLHVSGLALRAVNYI